MTGYGKQAVTNSEVLPCMGKAGVKHHEQVCISAASLGLKA